MIYEVKNIIFSPQIGTTVNIIFLGKHHATVFPECSENIPPIPADAKGVVNPVAVLFQTGNRSFLKLHEFALSLKLCSHSGLARCVLVYMNPV